MSPAALARAALGAAPRTAARLLGLFALYVAAMDLGFEASLVALVASVPALALLSAAGLAALAAAADAALAPGAAIQRAARALAWAGAGLAVLGVPWSLVARDSAMLSVVEGQPIEEGVLPGLPEATVGPITIRPRGPHLLSKTVTVPLEVAGSGPVEIGLFPPTRVGPWALSVFRFGYAPWINWLGADGRPRLSGYVYLGNIPHSEEEARLVSWTPEPNVMMGGGTFPPKREELVRSMTGGEHVFLRLEEATIAGTRRDLREPDAYRWLADGRLEKPVFFVQVFRGRERVYEGRVAGGSGVQFDGGIVQLGAEVALVADLAATRDGWLPIAALGLALLLAGALLGAGGAVARLARARRGG